MPSINEVIERVNRVRPDAIDDETKAAWLLSLDGQLFEQVILRHSLEGEDLRDYPKQFPEDGDKPLLVDAPYDELYDLYLMSKVDFIHREIESYNNAAMAYQAALDAWKKAYHKSHAPIGAGGILL